MLKRISPQDHLNPSVTKPAAALANTSAQLEPLVVPPAQQKADVATDPPEADPEPPVATEIKKKKKSKKN